MVGTLRHNWGQVREFERSLNVLSRAGFGPGTGPFEALNKARGQVLGVMGFRQPRLPELLLKLAGLSPGEVKLWHDGESGFMTEARAKLGAPPVYRHVPDNIAITILKGQLTHELEEFLLTPDTYRGE